MCAAAAAARLVSAFRCCVTSQAPAHQRRSDRDGAWTTSSAATDERDAAVEPSMTRCRRCVDAAAGCHPAGCAYVTPFDADGDPSTPVPVCCCERCDGGWFPPEVSLHLRCSCLRACDVDRVTTGRTLCSGGHSRCAWTGDVAYLDDSEKAEMSFMSRGLQGVDLLEGHCRRVSGTEDDAQTWSARLVPPSWSARSELVTGIRPPNRTIGHLYDAVLLHQRTCCTCRDVTDIPDDCDVSSSTKSALCRFFRPASSASSPRRRRFSGWTRKRKR